MLAFSIQFCPSNFLTLRIVGLPITHLDLTGFVFVGDEAILNLASATSLQMLSLSGTKLTDIGSSVFVHMLSLRELALDRTDIGDKSMEYIRGEYFFLVRTIHSDHQSILAHI